MKKHYRYFFDEDLSGIKSYPLVKIYRKFALFPKRIERKIIWLKYYFELNQLEVFRLGDNKERFYKKVLIGRSIFKFKSLLFRKKVIKNLYKEYNVRKKVA